VAGDYRVVMASVPPASILRPVSSFWDGRKGILKWMGVTRLAPEPTLVATRLGRERMVKALRELYRAVDILEPPRVEEYWIVIPADPALVYPGLQRAVPDWFELFVVPRGDRQRER
jgi:hypothetical protein